MSLRPQTFAGATLDDAMAQVRAALGPGAVVLSWRHARGGVELTASAGPGVAPAASAAPRWLDDDERRPPEARQHEAAGPEWDAFLASRTRPAAKPTTARGAAALLAGRPAAPGADAARPEVKAAPKPSSTRAPKPSALALALFAAGLDRRTALAWARDADVGPLLSSLIERLETRMAFAPLPAFPDTPLALVGPPGSGKTTGAAKLAARVIASGGQALLVSADAERTGGADQLRALARRLGADFASADTVADAVRLCDRGRGQGQAVMIDCAAASHLAPADLRIAGRLAEETGAEMLAVLPADQRGDDLADLAQALKTAGATRAIATRFDLTSRRAGVLQALAADGLPLTLVSDTPFIAGGLAPASARRLAGLILEGAASFTRSAGEQGRAA